MRLLPAILFRSGGNDVIVKPDIVNFIEGDFSAAENPRRTFEVTIPKAFNPATDFILYDDFAQFSFVGGVSGYLFGKFNWSLNYFFSSANATILQDAYGIVATNPGTIRLVSGSSNTASICIVPSTGANNSVGGNTPNLHYISAIASPDASTSNKRQLVGMVNTIDINDNPPLGIYFQATNTGNWLAITKNSSTTTTDTGIAQSTSFKRMEFLLNASGTSIGFYIDGTLVATHTTNIPSTGITPIFHIKNTASGSKRLDVDYVYVRASLMSR